MSSAQYDQIMQKLAAAGKGTVPGRSHHSAFGPSDHLMVYDVWDSQEAFEELPVGVDPGTPDIMPVHGIVR